MKFHGGLRFQGAGILRWIQRRADGVVELVFDCEGRESILEFSGDAWATIFKAAALLESGAGEKHQDRTTVSNPLEDPKGKGELAVDYLSIDTVDQPIEFRADDLESMAYTGGLPEIIMRTPGEEGSGISLLLSPKAAKALLNRVDKALGVQAGMKALTKPVTVPAHA